MVYWIAVIDVMVCVVLGLGVIGVSTVRTAMRVRGHNGNLQNSVASTYVVSLYPALYIMYRR